MRHVAVSAVAAVVAAKLASNLGVYGTILGAGVVSAVVTSGGSLVQHFFPRTGEQIREAAVQAKPRARQVRVPDEWFTAFSEEFGEGTVYRARIRSWKRPLSGAVLVFGVTMGGITAYELVSGQNFGGDGKSTTIGNAVTGHNSRSQQDPTPPSDPSHSSGGISTGDGSPQDGGTSSGGGRRATPTPGHTNDAGTEGGSGTDSTTGPGAEDQGTPPTPTPTTPTPTPTDTGAPGDVQEPRSTPSP